MEYLFQFAHLDVLWGHEQDGVQHASIYLSHRYCEHKQPGEHAGQGVHHRHDRVAQQQPDISTDAPLVRREETEVKTTKLSRCSWFWLSYPVIWGLSDWCCWHWDLNISRWRYQKRSSVFVPLEVFTVVTVHLFRKNITIWRHYSGTLCYTTVLKP